MLALETSDLQTIGAVSVATRGIVIVAGFGCVFLGYRLFVQGVQRGGAGVTLQGGAQNTTGSLSMERGGPGLIFALFGMIVMIAGVFVRVGGAVTTSSGPNGPTTSASIAAASTASGAPAVASAAPELPDIPEPAAPAPVMATSTAPALAVTPPPRNRTLPKPPVPTAPANANRVGPDPLRNAL